MRVDGVRCDFANRRRKIAVFIDGCFWHWCSEHMRLPDTNRRYWWPKLLRNALRDIEQTQHLEQNGWKVIRVWEHSLR